MLTGQKHLRRGSGSYEQFETTSLVLMASDILGDNIVVSSKRLQAQYLNNWNLIPEHSTKNSKNGVLQSTWQNSFPLRSLGSLPQMLRHWVSLKEVQDCTFKVLDRVLDVILRVPPTLNMTSEPSKKGSICWDELL